MNQRPQVGAQGRAGAGGSWRIARDASHLLAASAGSTTRASRAMTLAVRAPPCGHDSENEMPVDSSAVLEDLCHMSRAAAVLARYPDVDVEREVTAMAVICARLKTHVVAADGLGTTPLSLSELGLRAKRWIVLAELERMQKLTTISHHERRIRSLPSWEPFCGIVDLTICVQDALNRITNEWTTYRNSVGVERATYRNALRDAHDEMRTLGYASELAQFLRRVQRLRHQPGFRDACARMSATLTLSIDVDPDLPLLMTISSGAAP